MGWVRAVTGGVERFLRSRPVADLLLWAAISVPLLLSNEPLFRPAGLPPNAVKAAEVLLLGLAVAVARRHPVLAASVPTAFGLAAQFDLTSEDFMVSQVVLSYLLGFRTARLRTGLLFFGGACLTGLVVVALSPDTALSDWIELPVAALVGIMLPWLAGRYARQHDQLVRAGWELAERLEHEQDLAGERIRLLERSRIAGDMHDSLGHELSLVALRAAALQVHSGLDSTARRAAAELRESAASATERLREIISVLREDSENAPLLPSGDTIAALVGRAAASGMAVTLEGESQPLPPMADRAAYRVVQEALTNANKHAPGAAVVVRQGKDPATGEAVITVNNQAPPAGSLPIGQTGGFGLVGLDERVRLAGGRLRAGPVDGGFEVTTRLPLTVGAAATPPESKRELDLARRKVRRSIIDAIWLPAAAAGAVLLLSAGYDVYRAQRTVLDTGVYQQLEVGQSRAAVVPRLPPNHVRDNIPLVRAPADPAGTDECLYYRINARSLTPLYRLCFSAGVLSHKDEVPVPIS